MSDLYRTLWTESDWIYLRDLLASMRKGDRRAREVHSKSERADGGIGKRGDVDGWTGLKPTDLLSL